MGSSGFRRCTAATHVPEADGCGIAGSSRLWLPYNARSFDVTATPESASPKGAGGGSPSRVWRPHGRNVLEREVVVLARVPGLGVAPKSN